MEREEPGRDSCRGAGEIPFRLKLSRGAEGDLREIWRHSAVEWGSAKADEYLADILAAFDLLCERPRVGTQRKHRRRTYRRWPINSHAVFYRVEGRQISVIRILHCRMKEDRYLP